MPKYRFDLDAAFQALADGKRRAMIQRLSRGSATVSELAAPLGLSLPAAVQHLAVLEGSGLVHSRKLGRSRHCELDRMAMGRVERWMTERRQEAEERLDRLEAYLAAHPEDPGQG